MDVTEVKLLNKSLIDKRQYVLGKYVLGEPLTKEEKHHLWYALLVVANMTHQSSFNSKQKKQSVSTVVDRVMCLTDFIETIRPKIANKNLTPNKAYAYLFTSYRKEYYNCLGKQELEKHYTMGYDISLVRQYVLFKRSLNKIRKLGLPFTRTNLLNTLLELSPVKTERGKRIRELQVDMWVSTFIRHEYLEGISFGVNQI